MVYVCLYVLLFFYYLSVCLSVKDLKNELFAENWLQVSSLHLTVYLSVCLSVCLSVGLSFKDLKNELFV